MKLVSWNVNGLRAVIKKNFFEFIEEVQPDILGLQETKIQGDQIPDEMRRLDDQYMSYYDFAIKRGYSGTALFSKIKPLNVTRSIGDPKFETEGRIVCAEYEKFFLFNIYFPNGQKDDDRLQYKMAFYEQLLKYIEELRKTGKHVIISGDVNTAHTEIDLANPKENEKFSGFLPIERAWIDQLISKGYVDTFRHFDQRTEQYSWWSYRAGARPRNIGWRIDYFFVNQEFLPYVKNAFILQDIEGSDHCPVGIEIEI